MIDVSLQLTVNTVNAVDLEVHVCTQFKKLILFIFCWTRDTCSSYIHTYIHSYSSMDFTTDTRLEKAYVYMVPWFLRITLSNKSM